MPKLKTKSGAAKRFRKTATGQFKCSHSHASHILTKKSPKRKRNLRKSAILHKSDSASAQKMLPYA